MFRAAATGDVISYDDITQFCQLHEGLIFAETSAAREILSDLSMQIPEQLVDVGFERDCDENGVIPVSECDYPFLLAVMMGTEPNFTRDMVHSCCI